MELTAVEDNRIGDDTWEAGQSSNPIALRAGWRKAAAEGKPSGNSQQAKGSWGEKKHIVQRRLNLSGS